MEKTMNIESLSGVVISSPSVIVTKFASKEEESKLLYSSPSTFTFNVKCVHEFDKQLLNPDNKEANVELGDIMISPLYDEDENEIDYSSCNAYFCTSNDIYDKISIEAFKLCFSNMLQCINDICEANDTILLYINANENSIVTPYETEIDDYIASIKSVLQNFNFTSLNEKSITTIIGINDFEFIDNLTGICKDKKDKKKKKKKKNKK